MEEVVLCFDADAAGQKAAERSLPALLEANVTVRVATMPPGEDPDSLIRTQGAEAFAERIAAAQDFFDFQIERLGAVFDLNTPRGKTQFSRRMAESVSLLTDPVLREAVVGKVSALLGISAQDFRRLAQAARLHRSAFGRRSDLKASESAAEETPWRPTPRHSKSRRKPSAICSKSRWKTPNPASGSRHNPGRKCCPRIGGSDLLFHSLAAELTPGTPPRPTLSWPRCRLRRSLS